MNERLHLAALDALVAMSITLDTTEPLSSSLARLHKARDGLRTALAERGPPNQHELMKLNRLIEGDLHAHGCHQPEDPR